MFIVEGSDDLGKTTLCKNIVRRANACSLHSIYYNHMGRPTNFDFCRDYVDRMSVFAVQDRFHLGSLIWHDGVMSQENLRWIEGELYQRASLIVVLAGKDDQWYRSRVHDSKRKDDQMFNPEKLVTANQRYKNIFIDRDALIDEIYYVDVEGYPSDRTIDMWISDWFKRIRVYLEMEGLWTK